jgi:hypothetical protein
MAMGQTMQISDFGAMVSPLPIVLSSYRIKGLLDCSSSRKRGSSSLESSQYVIQESL